MSATAFLMMPWGALRGKRWCLRFSALAGGLEVAGQWAWRYFARKWSSQGGDEVWTEGLVGGLELDGEVGWVVIAVGR